MCVTLSLVLIRTKHNQQHRAAGAMWVRGRAEWASGWIISTLFLFFLSLSPSQCVYLLVIPVFDPHHHPLFFPLLSTHEVPSTKSCFGSITCLLPPTVMIHTSFLVSLNLFFPCLIYNHTQLPFFISIAPVVFLVCVSLFNFYFLTPPKHTMQFIAGLT